MRTWRVGTFSMGASLLFLGLFLLLSQFIGMDIFNVMVAWWPLLLVVLGIEILLYLFLSRKEQPYLKYDFLSIFFVGLIGTIGIGFAVLSATGIMTKVEHVISRAEQSFELPDVAHQLDEGIKRVVIETEHYPITIEGTTASEVSMFGTYRASVGKNEKLIASAEDYVILQEKGDTLYVQMKEMPTESGPFHSYATLSATVLVPQNVKLEVIGNHNEIKLKPRLLMSSWSVDQVSNVSVYLEEQSDILVSAIGTRELNSRDNLWVVTEEQAEGSETGYNEEGRGVSGSYKQGDGNSKLSIMNSYSVSLNTGQ